MSPLILDYPRKRRLGMTRTRHFLVAPAKIEDVRRLVDIEFLAFENEQVNQVLSFRDHKKHSHFKRSVRLYEETLAVEGLGEPRYLKHASDPTSSVSFKKIVDTETREIVSFAKIEMKSYAVEELQSPLDSGHEREPRMNRDWFALNERLRRDYVGLAEHCYIGMLATKPKDQHNGAGTMLLEEILGEADEAGVEVYLEATDTAKPLYERHGFEAITELRFDPGQYGVKGLGIERQTVMVRGALSNDGMRQPVKPWSVAVAHARAGLQEAWSACI